ncbi:MAG: 16S rRNA (adenine(1518)-N(6)/adenine(1519)-N(6))-dimethyltransferase RsmA [Brevinematia bacterium]
MMIFSREFNPFSIPFLKKFLKENGIFLSKNRGQNFLIDKNIAIKILENVKQDSIVLEVGSGFGALTFFLSEKAKKLYALEIDGKIYNILKKIFGEDQKVCLLNEDFLKFKMEKLPEEKIFFVSNLPYSISGEAIRRFIEEKRFEAGIVMLQKDFVERMLSLPGEKGYGVLSILSHFYLNVEKLFSVSRNCFFPTPSVDSIVVKLTKKDCDLPHKSFADFLKKVFSRRRKILSNSLKELSFSREDILNCKVDLKIRPENLELESWAILFEYYQSHKSPGQ